MISPPPVERYPLKVVKAYADARKRVHYALTVTIMVTEFLAVTVVTIEMVHIILTATVAAWEAMVIAIGEDGATAA